MKIIKYLLLVVITFKVGACANLSNNSKPTLQDSLDYLKALAIEKSDSLKQIIFLANAKAEGDSLDFSPLNNADSSDVHSLILNRQLEIQEQKIKDKLALHIARGIDPVTEVNYKVKIANINAAIANNIAKHYWLYVNK